MPLRTLQELSFLDICYDYRNEWLQAEWRGDISFEQARQGGEAILHYVEAEHCRKLFNDNQLVTEMWLEADQWREMNIFPRLHAAGLQYVAWVYSPNVYSRFSVDRSVTDLTHPVALTFDEPELARNWLRLV
ncbi:hypothetical protein [Hymenobacter cellulosilyticus]|uniref:STAS/SEC14 domain-containing protein n=1 Tax=Hymenobacter cellulosilyticus TaxID=2932248 RepID=A0A8T9Q6Z3_9BACT|nr:hypothetical protein [Hymenobacter cellulosilyticus]UOQ72722.1 hypothetical protein MUN79_01635 [Hymenobacter cellulosilyticus]